MVLEISPYSGQAVKPAPAAWPDILMEVHWERWQCLRMPSLPEALRDIWSLSWEGRDSKQQGKLIQQSRMSSALWLMVNLSRMWVPSKTEKEHQGMDPGFLSNHSSTSGAGWIISLWDLLGRQQNWKETRSSVLAGVISHTRRSQCGSASWLLHAISPLRLAEDFHCNDPIHG